eukprot:3316305-Pleurochrysis_carterae.AAC.3
MPSPQAATAARVALLSARPHVAGGRRRARCPNAAHVSHSSAPDPTKCVAQAVRSSWKLTRAHETL